MMSERDRRIFGVLGLLSVAFVAGTLAAAELPRQWKNWSHFREVEVESVAEPKELLSLVVPEDLYEHARSDLADLRLIDRQGDEVGYVLYSPGRQSAIEWRTVELSDSGVVPDQYSQVVADTGDAGLLHNAIEVTLAADDEEIFTWTEVAASADRETWRIVRTRAPLYRFDNEELRGPVKIRYPRTRDRWLRLRLLDGELEVSVERLRVAETSEAEVPRLSIRRGMALRSDAPDGESIWEPHGALPLVPVSAARVETEREEFYRPVVVSSSDDGETWKQVGRGHVYRYRAAGDEDSAQSEALEIEVRETAAPYWRITVMDRGDPPISDLEVSLQRDRKSMVFKPASPGPHRLLYGNHLAEAPEYELAKLATRDELAVARELDLRREQANEAYLSPDPFTERHPIILWAALGLAVLIVGGLALKALR